MTTGDRLFLRRWSITIGSGQGSSNSTNNQSALTSGNTVEGTTAVDIKFKIKRTLHAKPATCELDIFNLTADHRNTIVTATRPVVQVSAGYKDTGVSCLFNGIGSNATVHRKHPPAFQKAAVDVVREGTDVITRIRAGDGHVAYTSARVSQSFAANASLSDVITAIANAMGVGVGNTQQALTNVTLDQLGSTFVHGTVVHGNAAHQLSTLLRSCNLDWSIQEGVIQILPRLGALQRQAVVISADHGMIGIPSVGNHGVVTVVSLIQPGLVPGQLISLQSAQTNGTYRIEDAEYTGDSIGPDWQVEMVGRPVPS